uniref:Uncharacterized protein n=1 Tax=Anguilla anguilla TaxID=7936 RepID=A0A0E9XLF2_ANGAN
MILGMDLKKKGKRNRLNLKERSQMKTWSTPLLTVATTPRTVFGNAQIHWNGISRCLLFLSQNPAKLRTQLVPSKGQHK